MLVEQRTYTTQPGKVREDLSLHKAEGLCLEKDAAAGQLGIAHSRAGAVLHAH